MAFAKAYFGDFSGLNLKPFCREFVFLAFQKNEHCFDIATDCGVLACWQEVDNLGSEKIVIKSVFNEHDTFCLPLVGKSVITENWVCEDRTSFYDLHHCTFVNTALTEFNLFYVAYAKIYDDLKIVEKIGKRIHDKRHLFLDGICESLLMMRSMFNNAMIQVGDKYRFLPKAGTVQFFNYETTPEENKREGLRITNWFDAVEYVIPQKNSDQGKVDWRMKFSETTRFYCTKASESEMILKKAAIFENASAVSFKESDPILQILSDKQYDILDKKALNGKNYVKVRNESGKEIFVCSERTI